MFQAAAEPSKRGPIRPFRRHLEHTAFRTAGEGPISTPSFVGWNMSGSRASIAAAPTVGGVQAGSGTPALTGSETTSARTGSALEGITGSTSQISAASRSDSTNRAASTEPAAA